MKTIKITRKELKQKIKESLSIDEISDELVGRAAQAMKDRHKETGIPQDKRAADLLYKQKQITQQIKSGGDKKKAMELKGRIDPSKYIGIRGVLFKQNYECDYVIHNIDVHHNSMYNFIQLEVNISYIEQLKKGMHNEPNDMARMRFIYDITYDSYLFRSSSETFIDIKIDRKLANVLTQLIQLVNPESKFKRYDFFPVIGLNERFDGIFKAVINEIIAKH